VPRIAKSRMLNEDLDFFDFTIAEKTLETHADQLLTDHEQSADK